MPEHALARIRDEGRREVKPMVGESEPIQQLRALILQVASSDCRVLIEGESGTGKELVAHAIHAQSKRADKPIVIINCAGIPENLLESELFGHERGAFTDARNAHDGYFAAANGGTLFLDEIGTMPPAFQAKLLRVLETQSFKRVGSTRETHVDVRIIAATNASLEDMVRKHTFRLDLYYRLAVVKVQVPPLRERLSDIPLLAAHFLEKHGKLLAPEALPSLLGHCWPGNIRELENRIERAVVLNTGTVIEIGDFDFGLSPATVGAAGANDIPMFTSLRELERLHIVRVLAAVQGNKPKAAHILGISLKTLYNRLNTYGIRSSS